MYRQFNKTDILNMDNLNNMTNVLQKLIKKHFHVRTLNNSYGFYMTFTFEISSNA